MWTNDTSFILFLFGTIGTTANSAKHRDLLPTKKKGPEFKIGTERLKKYDQMLEEFPKNLEIPVDAPFLSEYRQTN